MRAARFCDVTWGLVSCLDCLPQITKTIINAKFRTSDAHALRSNIMVLCIICLGRIRCKATLWDVRQSSTNNYDYDVCMCGNRSSPNAPILPTAWLSASSSQALRPSSA